MLKWKRLKSLAAALECAASKVGPAPLTFASDPVLKDSVEEALQEVEHWIDITRAYLNTSESDNG
jgi:hypothetical protein